MLRPGRLLLLLTLGAFVYLGFFDVPAGAPGEGAFDPVQMADHELDAWKALHTHEDVSTYLSVVMMEREQHRYSWFRSVQSAYYLGRAMIAFVGLQTRYERVLPDLEASAIIERDWTKASFDPAVVARAQLNWWVTRKMPNLNTLDAVSNLMAEEYAQRYRVDSSRALEAAALRAEAAQLRDEGGSDPDWNAVGKLLTESYRALGSAIQGNYTARKTKKSSRS